MDQKQIVMLLVQGSLILFVASIGLRAKWRDVLAVMEDPGSLFRAFIAVNVVVPIVAVVMCLLLPIERDTRAGLIIMAVSPLAPFVTAKMIRAGETASEAVGHYVSLILLAIFVVPLTVALLNAIFRENATVSLLAVAKLVFISVVLPLALALFVSEVFPAAARRLAPIFTVVGATVLLLFVVAVLYKAGGQMIGLVGDGTLLAIIITVVAGLAAGHMLGGPRLADRESLALDAATRHPGIAALIANSNSEGQQALLAIVLFLIVSVIVSAVYQQVVKRRVAGSEHDTSGA